MMRPFTIIVLVLFTIPVLSFSQQLPFSTANVTLPQLAYSACGWGDFDQDGDLDLALTGAEGNTPVTKIFRNDHGNFTDIQANLLALHFGSLEWGDYDNDGDLDLLVTGMDSQGNSHTVIFDNINGTFIDSGISFPGIADGQASWGDFNNDGNPDILLAGNSMVRIYENNGDRQFAIINSTLPSMESAMCSWNDYNNDGQSDVLVCGSMGGGIFSSLFRNDHGVFTEVNISPEPFTGLYSGQARWADLDNDGDQDLVIAGMDLNMDGYFLLYRNDGNDHFTKFDANTVRLLNPSFDLGDFNGDGLLDIILMGTVSGCGGTAVTILKQNEGFMNFLDVSSLLPGYKQGGVTWGDYNNDGFTDLLFTGLDAFDVPKTGLYLNTLGDTLLFTVNTPPSAPQGLNATMDAGKAILHWNSAADTQTPKGSLSYNIRIGSLPDSQEILSPLAMLYSGSRKIAAPGNASADTSWVITGIPPGTYYFSVQCIDNGFKAGVFSGPCMFTYAPVGIDETKVSGLSLSPNPCHDRLYFNDGTISTDDFRVRIINANGNNCHESVNPKVVDVSAWPNGIYLVHATNSRETKSFKFIKN